MSDVESLSESDTWSDEESPETSDLEFIDDRDPSDISYEPSEGEESDEDSDSSFIERRELKRKLEEDSKRTNEKIVKMEDLLQRQLQQVEALNKNIETLEKFKSVLENTKAVLPDATSVKQPPPLDKSPAEVQTQQ